MKVFKVYFLALLLVFSIPLLAEDSAGESEKQNEAVSEETPQDTEEAKEDSGQSEEENKAAEEKKTEEEKKAEAEEEGQPEEKKVADEQKQTGSQPEEVKSTEPEQASIEVKTVEPEAEEAKPDEPKVTAKVESEEEGEADKKDEKKNDKKFNVSLNNGFNHGLAKERKAFSYNLNLGASYSFPWKMSFGVDVGFNALYRYDIDQGSHPTESGEISTGKVTDGTFDGTPLNLALTQTFDLFWDIGGSAGIGVALPFTSTELWDQYKVRTMLSANVNLKRAFKVAKETSVTVTLAGSYSKTFAKDGYGWDDYTNTPINVVNEHTFNLGGGLSLGYKTLTLTVSAGTIIGRNYQLDYTEYTDWESTTADQDWYYLFSFGADLAYTYKDWNFGLRVMTNAPEYNDGHYSGYNTVPGDPSVKNGSANYPLKPQYTMISANIGYSYSF